VRFANIGSWQIRISADESLPVFALWLRDVEAIEISRSPLVPERVYLDAGWSAWLRTVVAEVA
jgi:hypothetical protein